jgi:hypothetical protein
VVGLLAGSEAPAVLDDEPPVSAGAVPAPLESVAGDDEAELVALAASVEPAGAVELTVPEPVSAGAESVAAGSAGAVDVPEPVESEPVVGVADDVPPAVPVGDEVPAVGAGSVVVTGGVVPPLGVATGGVNPPVAPDPELTAVGVEVAPAEVVEVLEPCACGVPSDVELTVPSGDGRVVAGA